MAGAGLVGPVAALFLARRGYGVDLYEREPFVRGAAAGSGRSINLTLCTRGLAALDEIGLGARVRRLTVPAHGRTIHATDGTSRFQPYGSRGEALHVISRAHLNAVLREAVAGAPGIDVHDECEIAGLALDPLRITVRDRRTGVESIASPAHVVAADGAHSRIRRDLAALGRVEAAQEPLTQAYRELTIGPDRAGSWRLDPAAIHIWPRGRFMLMAFANIDGSFTVALYLPRDGERSFAALSSEADLAALFEESFPDALHHMPRLTDEFFTRPTATLGTVRCRPWVAGGAVALLGDAAHALVPFYGQGANFGFEDCAVLDRCLADAGDDWDAALARYDAGRRPDGEIIADLAVAHLEHLQQAIDSTERRRRQDVEQRMHELFPDAFTPLYSMIAFTTLSYAEASRRHRLQQPAVDRVLSLCAHDPGTDVDAAIHAVLAEQAR